MLDFLCLPGHAVLRSLRLAFLGISTLGIVGGCGTEECVRVPSLANDKGPVFYDDEVEADPLSNAKPTRYLARDLAAMTFNVLYESGFEPVLNFTRNTRMKSWVERKEIFGKIVRNYSPSLLSLQESTSWQAVCMQQMFPDYRFHYGAGLTDSILAWRSREFDELQSGVLELPLPKGKIMTIPRSAAWAILRDKVTTRKVLAIATHLDNRYSGFQARHLNEQMKGLLESVDAGILFGDTNIDARSPTFQKDFLGNLWQDSLAKSKYVKKDRTITPSTFLLAEKRIDHVVYAGQVTPLYWEVTTIPGSRTPFSDHWPVSAVFQLRSLLSGGNEN